VLGALIPAGYSPDPRVRKRRPSHGALALLALATGSVGCILFVSPDSGGTQCAFRGEGTACGMCLLAQCASAIDAACFDDSVMSAMEECAADGDDACNTIPASDVLTCLTGKCGALCYEMIGQSITDCTDSVESPGLACSCVYGTPSTLDCSSATYPRTKCCAPTGWPGPKLECECNAIGCFPDPSTGGCTCSLTGEVENSTAQTCTGAHCCVSGTTCGCSSHPCANGEDVVPNCDIGGVGCPTGTTPVPSCSVRQ
jgi:hypothetical protein